MALVILPGYTWSAGEVVTATKLNLAASPTIADGQSYTFAAGAAATPSINFSTATTTGFYLGASSIGFSVGAVSVGVWTAMGLFPAGAFFAADGLVGTPSISFGNDQDTGFYRVGANSIGIALGGALVGTWASGSYTSAVDLIVTNLCARCSANVVKTADTTLADLTGMSITVTTGGVYALYAAILMSTTTTGGFRTTLDGTAVVANMRVQNVITQNGAGTTQDVNASTIGSLGGGDNVASTGTSSTGLSEMMGTLEITTGGTLKIQVAQNNAAGASTFYKNSYIWAQRIS